MIEASKTIQAAWEKMGATIQASRLGGEIDVKERELAEVNVKVNQATLKRRQEAEGIVADATIKGDATAIGKLAKTPRIDSRTTASRSGRRSQDDLR